MVQFRVGDYVEAPVVTAEGETRFAVAVVERIVTNDQGTLASLDFGPDVVTVEGQSTMQWRQMDALRPIAAASGSQPLAVGGGADKSGAAARSVTAAKPPGAKSAKSTASDHHDVTNATATATSTASTDDDASAAPLLPTTIDHAVWTLVAGLGAIMECRRPFLTLLFFAFTWLHKELIMHEIFDLHPRPGAVGTYVLCDQLTVLADEAPKALHRFVVHGAVPDVFSAAADHLLGGGALQSLHAVIENAQRSGTGTAAGRRRKTAVEKPRAERGGREQQASSNPKADIEKQKKKKTKKPDIDKTPAPGTPVASTPEAPTIVLAPATPPVSEHQPPAADVPKAHDVPALEVPEVAAAQPPRPTDMPANPEPGLPPRAPAARDVALCRRTSSLALSMAMLVIIAATTAYPFANPRAELARFATKFKGLAYITAVLIFTYALLDSEAARQAVRVPSSAAPQWLHWCYDNILDVNTLTTFVLGHLRLNVLIGIVGMFVSRSTRHAGASA